MRTARRANWLWFTLAVVAADRASKFEIESTTSEGFHRVLIRQFASLVHSRNAGVAFGLFSDSGNHWFTVLLLIISVVVVILLAWLLLTSRTLSAISSAGLALLAGGAAGNLIDRLLHGAVTDFVELHVGTFYWPAFNLADSAITIGAALLVIEMFRPASRANRDSRRTAAQE